MKGENTFTTNNKKSERYIIDYNLKNGLGKPSISLYLTGCDKKIKCFGCHNYELQKESINNYNVEEIFKKMEKLYVNARIFNKETKIVFLGGEPTASYNIDIVYEISKLFREKYENADTVLYSWRNLEEIEDQIDFKKIRYIDYGVLGSYDEELHEDKVLPASSNQYIYDFENKKKLKPIEIK
jgi:anaerobic ribonucleoside-triphosphate reductase activating protein